MYNNLIHGRSNETEARIGGYVSRRSMVVIAFVICAVSIAGLLAIWQQKSHTSQTNLQIIDKAIRSKDKSMCQKVTETTKPGINDEPIRVTGGAAVETCEIEVEQGHRIHGG